VTLLQVLSHHLQGQTEKTGRTGFKLCVLHICGCDSAREDDEALFEELKARFPEHDYHTARLSDSLKLEDVASLLMIDSECKVRDAGTLEASLHSILQKATSATSRQDIEQTLKQRLTVDFAKANGCDAIILDHSATKLAERTLSETAKGRGIALPWIVADGESLHGVPFYHPLRELLNKELKSFVEFAEPPYNPLFFNLDAKPAVSTKNTTIDDLVQQYFESVEQEYPSIVANVVRTTGKLPALPIDQAEQCELCNMPLQGHAPEKSRLCHGCIRMLPVRED
jgi:cytoplasmic tRNA 2-thiolation protein 2